MSPARILNPPPGEAWRLFRPMWWEPRRADRLCRVVYRAILRGEFPSYKRQEHSNAAGDMLLCDPVDEVSARSLCVTHRNLWIAMDYALRRRVQEAPTTATEKIATNWRVGDEVVKFARDRYYKLARRAIDEYIAGGVSEREAVERFRHDVDRSRELLLHHHGPWTKRVKRSTE